MFHMTEELFQNGSLMLGLLRHKPVNIDTVLVLFGQDQVYDPHDLDLANAHSARNGLLHQCRGPPRTHEDAAIKLL